MNVYGLGVVLFRFKAEVFVAVSITIRKCATRSGNTGKWINLSLFVGLWWFVRHVDQQTGQLAADYSLHAQGGRYTAFDAAYRGIHHHQLVAG
jgi:hypothetical protein